MRCRICGISIKLLVHYDHTLRTEFDYGLPLRLDAHNPSLADYDFTFEIQVSQIGRHATAGFKITIFSRIFER